VPARDDVRRRGTVRRALLALTVIGFVVPNTMVVVFMARHGVGGGTYLHDWIATLPAAQLTADLVICALSFFVWAAWDGPRSAVVRWWLIFPATALVGLCFAIPLYLVMRETALHPTKGSR
jgi:Terpene cyclase DEP1